MLLYGGRDREHRGGELERKGSGGGRHDGRDPTWSKDDAAGESGADGAEAGCTGRADELSQPAGLQRQHGAESRGIAAVMSVRRGMGGRGRRGDGNFVRSSSQRV